MTTTDAYVDVLGRNSDMREVRVVDGLLSRVLLVQVHLESHCTRVVKEQSEKYITGKQP